jgi:tetratricopeptide (TPR) repeat protein
MKFFQGVPEDWADKAHSLYKKGKYKEAIRLLEKVNNTTPRDSCAWFMMGTCYLRLGLIDDALVYIDKSLGIKPNYSPALTVKGIIILKKINIKTDASRLMIDRSSWPESATPENSLEEYIGSNIDVLCLLLNYQIKNNEIEIEELSQKVGCEQETTLKILSKAIQMKKISGSLTKDKRKFIPENKIRDDILEIMERAPDDPSNFL